MNAATAARRLREANMPPAERARREAERAEKAEDDRQIQAMGGRRIDAIAYLLLKALAMPDPGPTPPATASGAKRRDAKHKMGRK